MAKGKQKYYVVWVGHTPGIYKTWEECNQQIKNYPNARYKSFPTKEEAEDAYHGSVPQYPSYTTRPSQPKTFSHDYIVDSISVDAACSGNPGKMEYQGVYTKDRTRIFHFGPVAQGTNNIGEFLAIVHALAWLMKQGDNTTPVYSDSKIAIGWIKGKQAKTKLTPTRQNKDLFDMIKRAETWLRQNKWTNPLLKWETEKWGESPADFGRK